MIKLTERPLVVFAYDFPHRKTYEFLSRFKALGYENVVVLAAPKQNLKTGSGNNTFSSLIDSSFIPNTQDICVLYGYSFFSVAHHDHEAIEKIITKDQSTLAFIAGARILKAEIIDLFEDGVINFHPGKLPQTSGLDAIYWSIKNNVQPGVSVHFVNEKVDAGRLLFFRNAMCGKRDSLSVINESIFQAQLLALSELLERRTINSETLEDIIRPNKNPPMTTQEKREVELRFEEWRSTWALC